MTQNPPSPKNDEEKKEGTADKPTNPFEIGATESDQEGNYLMIGGEKVYIRDTPRTVEETPKTALYPKEERDKLPADRKIEIFKAAVAKRDGIHFEFQTLSLDDEHQLKECLTLDSMVRKVKAIHRQYDMDNVFNIVQLDESGTPKRFINLYDHYDSISIQMVARSNEWYTIHTTANYYAENLTLTFTFFENNMDDDLFSKNMETYQKFPAIQRGGSLLFIIMMALLVSQTEEAALKLKERLEKLDLKDIPGEDVPKAVSLIRSALKRLGKFRPDDIVKTLLRIFQTSSYPEFNATFAQLERQRQAAHAFAAVSGKPVEATYTQEEIILHLAEQLYRTYLATDDWLGLKIKAAGFQSAEGGVRILVCWNCAGNHNLDQCPKPRNQQLIKINRKKF